MAYNETNPYDIDPHIAELYDAQETQADDIAMIRLCIGRSGPRTILEPFTGTGRILLPLLADGHTITGLDQARSMIERARVKLRALPSADQARATFLVSDVVQDNWPAGFDLVILGGNCFYELATPQEQENCVKKAARSLKPGGYVFIDNDHMDGDLDATWRGSTAEKRGIAGTCQDGTSVESWLQTIWFDAPNRLARFRRWSNITYPDGSKEVRGYIQQKHPVSAGEVQGWLIKYGFAIESFYGDRQATPFAISSRRAIFWARKALLE